MLTRRDTGFTVVELLFAVVITAVLSVAIGRTIDTASAAITRSGGQAVAAAQAVRFTAMLAYDMAGAADVYIFDETAPSNGGRLCTTWASGDSASWTDPTQPNFVRELFTVAIPTVTTPTTPGALSTFLVSRTQLVGYELRRQTSTTAKFDLYRVVCDGDKRSQRMLSFGSDLAAGASGISSMRCYASDGSAVTVLVGQSTMSSALPTAQRCSSYAFTPPYTGPLTAIRRIADEATLQRLTSVVTP